MNEKFLFKRFLEDKKVYALNERYWKCQFKMNLYFEERNILFKNIDSFGNKVYDANPIFTFVNNKKTKGVRIIQDDISLIDRNDKELEQYLISAWTDTITIYDGEQKIKINELVIGLFLTKRTRKQTMNLVTKWLENDLTQNDINNILVEVK